MLIGPRGTGKTALLGSIGQEAAAHGWVVAQVTAEEGMPLDTEGAFQNQELERLSPRQALQGDHLPPHRRVARGAQYSIGAGSPTPAVLRSLEYLRHGQRPRILASIQLINRHLHERKSADAGRVASAQGDKALCPSVRREGCSTPKGPSRSPAGIPAHRSRR